jgi:hypothetical protein
MPNVLDDEPLRTVIKRVSALIPDDKAAARFERIAAARARQDERNFRPASDSELAAGPAWVAPALARGEQISVLAPTRTCKSRLRTVAQRLAATCCVAGADCAAHAEDAHLIAKARNFLNKLDRASFDVVARKTLVFARLHEAWLCEEDKRPLCAPREIASMFGRAWSRITSLSELRAVGREFRNCLAQTTRTGSYGGMLRRGEAQFWVLRDAKGAGLIVAMAPAEAPRCFIEVRGPLNARIDADNPDLARLGAVLGLRPRDPPTPPPNAPPNALPAETTSHVLTRLLLLRQAAMPLRRRVAVS